MLLKAPLQSTLKPGCLTPRRCAITAGPLEQNDSEVLEEDRAPREGLYFSQELEIHSPHAGEDEGLGLQALAKSQNQKKKPAQSRLSTELAGMWSLTVGEKASGLEEGWKLGSLEGQSYPSESHSTPCSWQCRGVTGPNSLGQEHQGPLLGAPSDVEATSGQIMSDSPRLNPFQIWNLAPRGHIPLLL